MDNFDILNSIYKPLCDKSAEIYQALKDAEYQVTCQFHNNHSVKRNNDFATEYFPIPVISIENLGDIGVDINSVWFEVVLPKEKAIKLDYANIANRYRVEIYGSDNFLCDLYNEQIDVSKIVSNISNSSEINICILFYLNMDVTCGEIIEISQLIA